MEMQEIHNAALAYYRNLSDELKQKATEKFKEMDSNRNGTISSDEFKGSMEISSEIKRCFKLLDKSGDGKLDFDEFITLYYLVESGRGVFCSGHGCKAAFLNGLYFTCVECFHNNEAATFDLCTSCYGDRKYDHGHANFLDNYVLLRSKAACESTKAIDDDDDRAEPNPAEPDQLIRRGLQGLETVQGLEMASDFFSQSGSGTPSSPRSDSKLSESDCKSDQVARRSRSKRRALIEAVKSLKSHVSVGDVAAESSSCSIM